VWREGWGKEGRKGEEKGRGGDGNLAPTAISKSLRPDDEYAVICMSCE